jgi:hypothetical protein
MKKFLMMVAVAMMTAVSANAQSENNMFIKPMVGGTLSTVTKAENTKMKLGLVAGAEFGYHVIEPLAITGGLLVSMQGSGYKDQANLVKDYSWTTTYLNIPILANYYIVKGLAVKAGIQPGFMLSSKVKFEQYDEGRWESIENTSKDGLKKFDLSIPLGLSYEIADFVIDARYNLGLTKVIDQNENISNGAKNSVIMLTVGYKIPL